MIYLIHHNNKPIKVLDDQFEVLPYKTDWSLSKIMFSLGNAFPEELIIWCDEVYFEELNREDLGAIFHHKRIMASFSVHEVNYLPQQIGYVEDTPYANINFNVRYPTWMMNADVGGIHASVLNAITSKPFLHKNFNYFLNSLAKSTMRSGLFCYSEPNLLNEKVQPKIELQKSSTYSLFKFVRQHYKGKWVFFALSCFLFFEHKLPLWSYLRALLGAKYIKTHNKIGEIDINSSRIVSETDEYDVIVATIGRKQYLYDFLKDLSKQTLLPKKVIIVEQNPDEGSVSELDYLETETWPFIIKHDFIHRTGACNARNLALSEVNSEWVLFGDDDNRITPDLCFEAIRYIKKLGINVLASSYLQPGEKQTYLVTEQSNIFGSGSSMVKTKAVKKVKFDIGFEFGYGEDIDYGMQLRNIGEDIIYCPQVQITHLKAPMGGFRTKIVRQWANDPIPPMPSPTITLYGLKHKTNEQFLGGKAMFFMRYYRKQKIKNPFRYVRRMNKHWNSSKMWAQQLLKK